MKPYFYVKRVLDLIFAILLIFITSPIMVCSAIAIKIDDPAGPIIFKQERPGKDEQIFTIYKFRTMIMKRENNNRILSDGERLTRVGIFLRKTSIDELPQLINIIKGEMSFIGPRPLVVEYLPYYTKEERKRHSVLPGISGLAQVSGRNSLEWEKRLKLDIKYVKDISFICDIKIIIHTIFVVLRRDDVAVDTNKVEGNLANIRKKENN